MAIGPMKMLIESIKEGDWTNNKVVTLSGTMGPQQIIWRMDVKFSGRGGGIIIPYDFHDFLASCHGELYITSGLTSGGDPWWDLPIGKDDWPSLAHLGSKHTPNPQPRLDGARCNSCVDVFDHPVLGQMLKHTVGFPKIGERPNHPFQWFFL